ncbi:unnamed protein product, partial [Symbiodinium necroappetens]
APRPGKVAPGAPGRVARRAVAAPGGHAAAPRLPGAGPAAISASVPGAAAARAPPRLQRASPENERNPLVVHPPRAGRQRRRDLRPGRPAGRLRRPHAVRQPGPAPAARRRVDGHAAAAHTPDRRCAAPAAVPSGARLPGRARLRRAAFRRLAGPHPRRAARRTPSGVASLLAGPGDRAAAPGRKLRRPDRAGRARPAPPQRTAARPRRGLRRPRRHHPRHPLDRPGHRAGARPGLLGRELLADPRRLVRRLGRQPPAGRRGKLAGGHGLRPGRRGPGRPGAGGQGGADRRVAAAQPRFQRPRLLHAPRQGGAGVPADPEGRLHPWRRGRARRAAGARRRRELEPAGLLHPGRRLDRPADRRSGQRAGDDRDERRRAGRDDEEQGAARRRGLGRRRPARQGRRGGHHHQPEQRCRRLFQDRRPVRRRRAGGRRTDPRARLEPQLLQRPAGNAGVDRAGAPVLQRRRRPPAPGAAAAARRG